MATLRYDLRETPHGYWSVIDIFTGQAVEFEGVRIDRLTAEEADEMVDLLNLQDIIRRKAYRDIF